MQKWLPLAAEAETHCNTESIAEAPFRPRETILFDLLRRLAAAVREQAEDQKASDAAWLRLAMFANVACSIRKAHGWIAECAPLGWFDPRVFDDAAACMDRRGHEILKLIDAALAEKGKK